MDNQVIYYVLLALIIISALNLKLTLSLFKVMNNPPTNVSKSSPVHIGDKVPTIKAKHLISGSRQDTDSNGIPSVFLFLSSKCPTCKEKIPQLEALHPKVEPAGLRMLLISQEPKVRIKHFLDGSELLKDVLLVRNKTYKKLNPSLASPFYLFVDHQQKLQAYGTIGDDDWQSFVNQLNDIEAVEAEA